VIVCRHEQRPAGPAQCLQGRPRWIWMRDAETVPSAYFFKSGSVALRLPHSDMDCP
jgi:hypothetical protein